MGGDVNDFVKVGGCRLLPKIFLAGYSAFCSTQNLWKDTLSVKCGVWRTRDRIKSIHFEATITMKLKLATGLNGYLK
jgi:hypothetical protein